MSFGSFAGMDHEPQARVQGSVGPTFPLLLKLLVPRPCLSRMTTNGGYYKEKYSNEMTVNLPFEDWFLL